MWIWYLSFVKEMKAASDDTRTINLSTSPFCHGSPLWKMVQLKWLLRGLLQLRNFCVGLLKFSLGFLFSTKHKDPYAYLNYHFHLYGVIAQKGGAIPINDILNSIVYPRCLQQTPSIFFGVLLILGIGLLELKLSLGNNACLNAYIFIIIIKLMYWLVCYYFEVASTW